MSDSLIQVLQYFSNFSYPPTIEEAYMFLNKKISEREFNLLIDSLVQKKKILKLGNRLSINQSHFTIFEKRKNISNRLLSRSIFYIKLLRSIPTIQYVGISGSLSMSNTSNEGDIDIFIITKPNTIWTTRFLVLIYKYIIIAIRNDIGSKFCFNLFFSEKGLQIPAHKRNEYIGHELLQLKSVVNKEHTYEALLFSNKWLKKFFPNNSLQQVSVKNRLSNESKYYNAIDLLTKHIQILWLKKNGYKWQESDNQLWLIQEDFEIKALPSNAK